MNIPNPVNSTQIEFNALCDLGGGPGGGPARGKVQELLHSASKKLNGFATAEAQDHLATFSDRNPWHVAFAIGLGWGHLARIDKEFTDAATMVLAHNDPAAMKVACRFPLERGPDPIRQSLVGGHVLFGQVKRMPASFPADLMEMRKAQTEWMRPLARANGRPPYIGPWNASAMFMVAMFSMPALSAGFRGNEVALPTGGPISNAMRILHGARILSRAPVSKDSDEAALDINGIFDDNALFADVLKGYPDWNMLDVHSGMYMLGTRDKRSAAWD